MAIYADAAELLDFMVQGKINRARHITTLIIAFLFHCKVVTS